MTTSENNKKIDLDKLPEENLVHEIEKEGKKIPRNLILGSVLLVAAGIFSGFLLSNNTGKSGSQMNSSQTTNTTFSGKSAGVKDTKTFPDSAEGDLEAGGVNGEGTHKLLRPGGESQTVYLTSSVLDLNDFVGKKVKVWGQTFSAQKAGWLMDVGRVEVL